MALVVVACVAAFVLHGRMADSAQITVLARDAGVPISPLLEGSNVVWQRQGAGMLVTEGKVVKRPLAYDSFVVDNARNLKVPLLRFSGGQIYLWRDGVGSDRPQRYPHFRKLGDPAPNDVGTDEFMEFCRRVGAEPLICLPYRATLIFDDDMAPTAEQLAANWVEYCNAASPGLAYGKSRGWNPTGWNGQNPEKTEKKVPGSYLSTEQAPKGYFAWLREFFGHRKPYAVKYWECGNEIYLFQPGRPPFSKAWAGPEAYGDGFVQIAKAVKAVDPSVKIGIVADAGQMGTALDPWTKKLLGSRSDPSTALKTADFIIVHQYIGPNEPGGMSKTQEYAELFKSPLEMEQRLAKFSAEYTKPLILTEYNVQYGVFSKPIPANVPHQHHLKSALALAMAQNSFRRLKVEGACQFMLMEVGAWWTTSEWRMIFQDVDPATKQSRQGVTPTYQMLKLYREFGNGKLLKTATSGKAALDTIAVRDAKTGRIRVLVVNFSPSRDAVATIDLGGTPSAGTGVAYTLNSERGLEASNDSGEQVKVISSKVENMAAHLSYRFPAHSLTVLDLSAVK